MEKASITSIQHLRLFFVVLIHAFYFYAYGEVLSTDVKELPIIHLETERLPDLNISRAGHVLLCLDGELTVFGGHTDGFVPTATAEYLSGGVWHTVPLAYTHDQGTVLGLSSGKVFLGGGHQQPLGIGQLFSAEIYDPKTHTCQGFGCMQQKRAFADAVELADGKVVISGNWYADDGIEMFDNLVDSINIISQEVKPTSVARATPYMLRISDDDVIIFSSIDNYGSPLNSSIIDRIKGPSYHEPFLERWPPISTIYVHRSLNQFIGDESVGRYQWLIPVENEGRVTIAHVEGLAEHDSIPTFSLLPTTDTIPTTLNDKKIIYSSLIADRDRGIAYLIGNDDDFRIVVVRFTYDTETPNPLTIYLTDPQPFDASTISPTLTPEGDLVFAGGFLNNNFYPTNTVVRLPLGADSVMATDGSTVTTGDQNSHWMWIVFAFIIAGCIATLLYISHYRHNSDQHRKNEEAAIQTADDGVDNTKLGKNVAKDETLTDLFQHIEQLMDTDKLYLDPNLKASDVAWRVGSNTSYVSMAINSQRGCSFTQFLNSYRISYAQSLMRLDPERKLSEISHLSGFSTDSTFFRVFRTATGLSPKEWLAKIRNQK